MLRTSTLTDSVKLLLVVLADGMDERGSVSIPRDDLAARLGRSPRRITERIQSARKAGWLDTLGRAYPGRTAVYRATFPSPIGGRSVATIRGADGGPPFLPRMSGDVRIMVADGQPPIGKRESRSPVGLQRARVPDDEERSDEKTSSTTTVPSSHRREAHLDHDPWSGTA